MTHFPLHSPAARRALLAGVAVLTLASCDGLARLDVDLRKFGGNDFNTSEAVRQVVESRPEPDARGVISYPTYQVVVAKRGDSVASVAGRIGISADELASYNALSPSTSLIGGEVLALPRRVAEPSTGFGGAGERIDITSLASGALDRASASSPAATADRPIALGSEPVRHKVARGETPYSIARYYNVDVRALAEWNGLPADMNLREGQYLIIPLAAASPARAPSALAPVATTSPGAGSPTPTPPSAARPLPAEVPPAATAPIVAPAPPNLGATRTEASTTARMLMPVTGTIIRAYEAKKNDGIDIAAAPGTAVRAADAGTVAAITKDTEQVPILVIRHDNGLLSVYANIDAITVARGDRVTRGQTVARVRATDPSFVHFELRDGFDSVDPMLYLQ